MVHLSVRKVLRNGGHARGLSPFEGPLEVGRHRWCWGHDCAADAMRLAAQLVSMSASSGPHEQDRAGTYRHLQMGAIDWVSLRRHRAINTEHENELHGGDGE